MADEKEVIIVELEIKGGNTAEEAKKVETLTQSIAGLRKANKELREERDKLDTTTEAGAKKIAELNKSIDANNKAIKDNSSALEKQRLNVGAYTDALDKLVPGLGATANGFSASTKAALAFIATPIGAVIGALGLAISALIGFFKGSEEGQNKWNRITTIASEIFKKFTDVVVFLGEKIFNTLGKALSFAGDLLDRFASSLGISTKGIKDFFNAIDNKANAISTLREQIELLERALILQREISAARIAELKLAAEDTNKPIKERIAILQQAQQLIREQGELEIRLAKMRVELQVQETAGHEKTKEDLTKETELRAELFKIQKSVADQQKEAFTKEQGLRAQALALEKQLTDARQKGWDEEKKKTNEALKVFDKYIKEKANLEKLSIESSRKLRDEVSDEENEARKKQRGDEIRMAAASAESQMRIEAFKANGIALINRGLFQKNRALAVAANIFFKQNAIQETYANTYAAATAVLKSAGNIPYVGFILGPIAAAAAIAFGLLQVANIAGLNFQFAKGGDASKKQVSVGGRSHAAGGTKYWGQDGNAFEVEQGEGIYVLKRSAQADTIGRLSALNQKHGGVSFGDRGWYRAQGGQIETQAAAITAQQQQHELRAMQILLRSMPSPIVTVEDINAKQAAVGAVHQKATVIG